MPWENWITKNVNDRKIIKNSQKIICYELTEIV